MKFFLHIIVLIFYVSGCAKHVGVHNKDNSSLFTSSFETKTGGSISDHILFGKSSIEFLPKKIWSLILPPVFVSNEEVNKLELPLLWMPTCLAQPFKKRIKTIMGKKKFINYIFILIIGSLFSNLFNLNFFI